MTLRVIAFLTLALTTIGASQSAVTERDRAAMLSELDQLCSWTGLQRLGDFRDPRCGTGSDEGCVARVDLAVDGQRTHYRINFCREHSRLKICNFIPDKYDWHDVGLGYDTLKDQAARAKALAAVKKLNEHLHWKWTLGPEIQRVGRDILVSYETVSHEEQKKSGYSYLDPYVSFLVSRRGTVFAGFFGA
jgi:hypothetical protein